MPATSRPVAGTRICRATIAVAVLAVAVLTLQLVGAQSLLLGGTDSLPRGDFSPANFWPTALRKLAPEGTWPHTGPSSKRARDGARAAQRWHGVYAEPVPGWGAAFSNVVLVTAGNYAYLDMLLNWECSARSLGLKWLVVALDQELYDYLGPERAILTTQQQVSGAGTFRSAAFNKLSCNKIAAVKEMLAMGTDVVFMDPDNMLAKDPFAPGEELGGLIRHGTDYVYSTNIPSHHWWTMGPDDYDDPNGNAQALMTCSTGVVEPEGNTGLHFVRSTRLTKQFFTTVANSCQSQSGLDDQTIFWKALRKFPGNPLKTRTTKAHCTKTYSSDGSVAVSDGILDEKRDRNNVLTMCCLDARTYASGNLNVSNEDSLISYHANFAVTHADKIEKLKGRPMWPGLWFLRDHIKVGNNTDKQCDQLLLKELASVGSAFSRGSGDTVTSAAEVRWDRLRNSRLSKSQLVECRCACKDASSPQSSDDEEFAVVGRDCFECNAACTTSFLGRKLQQQKNQKTKTTAGDVTCTKSCANIEPGKV